VEAYGCTMSMGEGANFKRELASMGHQLVKSDGADLVVISTCTVIQSTENRMLKRVRELSSNGKKVVVAGCLAVVGAEQVLEADPGAVIMPFDRYDSFRDLVEGCIGRGGFPVSRPREVVEIIPIAQGCMGACAYCITRLARGGLVSRPSEDIVSAAREAVEDGSREIQITAQDTASYGMDNGGNLGDLARSLSALPGEFRIRVGMMTPDSLAKVYNSYLDSWSSPKIFRFLHLPVQSGSDAMLEAMRRRYGVDDFLSIVEGFRSAYPDLVLSTDIIVGFPGETEEDHEKSVRLIERVRPDIVNITRFSPRSGTPAFNMGNKIHGRIVKGRSRELTQLRFSISKEINRSRIGGVEDLLITERGKEGTVVGRTGSYRPVVVMDEIPLGSFVKVEVVEAAPTHLFGRLI